ncbi:C-X-C motif chemokine 11-6-like [Eleutherodactylus coqui]|uniref:C-X-C motif chemokine 11-6-like n=1 Tax=Eleutherodactylus coqui TaxID=57060 RepID=UPI00346292F1
MYRPVIVLLCSLLLLHSCVQGMSPLARRRCLCRGPGANAVALKQLKKLQVFPLSSKCEKMEVIAIMKNGLGEKCLNPYSKFVKRVIEFGKKGLYGQ